MTEVASDNAEPERAAPPRVRFGKGRIGNPTAKPADTLHTKALLAQRLMVDDIAAIINAVIEAAKAGDMAAAKLVLDRVSPVRKGGCVSFPLPPMRSAADVLEASNAVLAACASGLLTPQEAVDFRGLIAEHAKLIELADLEKRIEKFERERAP